MPEKGGKLHHHFIIGIFLLVFPPVSFYFMWRDKAYHFWFPTFNLFSGITLFAYTLILNFGVLPQIQNLINVYGRGVPVNLSLWVVIPLLILALCQIGLGFFLKGEVEKRGDLTRAEMAASMILFMVVYIFSSVYYGQILGPIYSSVISRIH